MCGIAGYFSLVQPGDWSSKLAAMTNAIRHRGPDDEGYVFANANNAHVETYSSPRSPASVAKRWPSLPMAGVSPHHIGLSHVRYSIVDLSDAGHQPMWSTCLSACLSFNGEIYNYVELREELQQLGYVFRTSSDTEVLLNGYLAWGEAVFCRLNGFFAVALYDARKKIVLLARDRLGKAHLYFVRRNGQEIFWASEIKALLAAGCFDRHLIDAAAVNDFLLYDRRDRIGTFWTEVQDFPPGHFVVIDPKKDAWNPQRYWAMPTNRWEVTDLSVQEAATGLQDILTDALRIRLRADVPIGFELSGGMDSSALVGLAAGRLHESITTYTIKFQEEHANEEPYARAVAQMYAGRIDYRVIQPPPEHFWSEADDFVWLQEEPFHAPNLHTNQHLRRCIKQAGAHVIISGAGADEMLAGYARDYIGPYLRYLLGKGSLQRFFSECTRNTEVSAVGGFLCLVSDSLLSDQSRIKLKKWILGEMQLLTRIVSPQILETHVWRPDRTSDNAFHDHILANMTHRRMNYWLRSGAKSDYGIPVESRAPFLDYRVVEYCCQLPPEYLISDGWHKHVLRMALKDYLPERVLWRRQKMGFPFPYREWLLENRKIAEHNAEGLDCPYIDTKELFSNYERLVKIAPLTLWRMLSLLLWRRRVIEGRHIYSQ